MDGAVVLVSEEVERKSLPDMVEDAAQTLAGAKGAAEVLVAKEKAGTAYDLAKRQGRLARARSAHDDVLGRVYRAQARAAEIEAEAKKIFADEYDAAQERGEVAGHGRPSDVQLGNVTLPSAADLGLSRKDIYEARLIRDAEKAHPGIVRETLDARLAAGEEPTRAALRQAVLEAAQRGLRNGGDQVPSRRNPHYERNPAFEAIAKLVGNCRSIIETRTSNDVEMLLSGFIDDGMRSRDLRTIRTCRDLLTEILEIADAR
jgi:hypothetical protein